MFFLEGEGERHARIMKRRATLPEREKTFPEDKKPCVDKPSSNRLGRRKRN